MAMILLAAIAAQPAKALPINGTVNLALWTIDVEEAGGADPGIASDLRFTNQIYSQIGLTFAMTSNNVVNNTPLPVGGWTVNDVQGDKNLMANNNVGGGANPINIYYLPDYSTARGAAFGQAWGNEDLGLTERGQRITQQGVVATSMEAGTPRRVDTVAHELGHILLNNWRFRTAEAAPNGSFHSGNYGAGVSPYVPNNTGAQNLMAAGGVRTIPGSLNQVAPIGNLDQINFNIGMNNSGAGLPNPGPNANLVLPQISAMYNDNTTVQNINRDNITVSVGANSSTFGWGLTQTIGGVSVNEAARRSSVTQTGTLEDFLFEFRNTGGFAAGAGLTLGFSGLMSLDAPYLGPPDSLTVMTADNILNNPGVFTTLGVEDFDSTSTFDPVTYSLGDTINFTDLPAGQDDILVEFSVAVAPEPATWLLLASCLVGFAFARRKLTLC